MRGLRRSSFRQIQSKGMTFDRIASSAIRLESCRLIVFLQAFGIEPIFGSRAPTAVAEHAAVPDPLQRRHSCNVAGASSSSLRSCLDLVPTENGAISTCFRASVRHHGSPLSRCELVVGVKRSCGGQSSTPLVLKYLPCRVEQVHRTYSDWEVVRERKGTSPTHKAARRCIGRRRKSDRPVPGVSSSSENRRAQIRRRKPDHPHPDLNAA